MVPRHTQKKVIQLCASDKGNRDYTGDDLSRCNNGEGSWLR